MKYYLNVGACSNGRGGEAIRLIRHWSSDFYGFMWCNGRLRLLTMNNIADFKNEDGCMVFGVLISALDQSRARYEV